LASGGAGDGGSGDVVGGLPSDGHDVKMTLVHIDHMLQSRQQIRRSLDQADSLRGLAASEANGYEIVDFRGNGQSHHFL
jgi:hypothetical protein